MTADEIAKLRALCAVKGGKCPVVLHENGGPLCAAREALPAALDEIERLRAFTSKAVCTWCGFEAIGDDRAEKVADHILLFCEKIPWKAVEAENDLLREEEARLRAMIAGLGLDPDAGVAK